MQGPLRRLQALLAPTLLRHCGGFSVSSGGCGCGRNISSSPAARGLEELFGPRPDKDGKVDHSAGRAWKADQLRLKSWDDLHKLWYVCLKERAMLQSQRLAFRARGEVMPNPTRLTKVRRTMGRIKQVLSERAIAEEDPDKSRDLRLFINTL